MAEQACDDCGVEGEVRTFAFCDACLGPAVADTREVKDVTRALTAADALAEVTRKMLDDYGESFRGDAAVSAALAAYLEARRGQSCRPAECRVAAPSPDWVQGARERCRDRERMVRERVAVPFDSEVSRWYIAAARTDLPRALDEIERLRAVVEFGADSQRVATDLAEQLARADIALTAAQERVRELEGERDGIQPILVAVGESEAKNIRHALAAADELAAAARLHSNHDCLCVPKCRDREEHGLPPLRCETCRLRAALSAYLEARRGQSCRPAECCVAAPSPDWVQGARERCRDRERRVREQEPDVSRGYIAAARTDLPRALDEIERLRWEVNQREADLAIKFPARPDLQRLEVENDTLRARVRELEAAYATDWARLLEQIAAADALADLVYRRQCCDGEDARQTPEACCALSAYLEARRG